MEVQSTIINLNSTNPAALYEFYRDKVGLAVVQDMGERALSAGGTVFTFDEHSEIKGGAKEPQRYLVDFMVENIDAEHDRLLAAGIPCIRDRGLEFWGGIVSTFVDPDGNFLQVMQYDPSKAQPMPAAAGQPA